ncbi:hypothetical protein [Anaerosporobacter sp.]
MTKDKLKGFLAVSVLLAVLGLFLLFNSVNFGTSLAESWIAKQGGADTAWYHIRAKGNINNFLAAGSILFVCGLTTTIFGSYKLLTIKEPS